MDPLVQCFGRHHIVRFQSLFIPLEEESVVFGDLGDGLGLEEMEVDVGLGEFLA